MKADSEAIATAVEAYFIDKGLKNIWVVRMEEEQYLRLARLFETNAPGSSKKPQNS